MGARMLSYNVPKKLFTIVNIFLEAKLTLPIFVSLKRETKQCICYFIKLNYAAKRKCRKKVNKQAEVREYGYNLY